MNNQISSKEQLIGYCKEIVRADGLQAISIRSVAKKAGMSVGAVYNYFPSKGELLAETIGSIWSEIFHFSEETFHFDDFTKCLEALLQSVEQGKAIYPDFFSSYALVMAFDDKIMGSKMMERYWQHIKQALLNALTQDKKIRENVFDSHLTSERYVEYVFELFLYTMTNDGSYKGILKLVRNSIYAE